MSVAERAHRDEVAADVGMWLFIASLVMFFGALFSGYVLLRAGSEAWVAPWRSLPPSWAWLPSHWLQTLLLAAVALHTRWDRTPTSRHGTGARPRHLLVAMLAVSAWGGSWLTSALALTRAGHGPASSVAAGSWFVMTGAIAVLALGGLVAAAWTFGRTRKDMAYPQAARQLERYWWLVVGCQAAVVAGMYLA